MSNSYYVPADELLCPTDNVGGIVDTCSRCGQLVPITSTGQYEALKKERQRAFETREPDRI